MYLANEFGRPFVQVIAIPLKRRMAALEAEPEPPATLFFEHSLPDDKIEPFLTFISERFQPLSIALDRILLEYHLKSTSLQWASTFDGIKDPIAIIDIDYVVRANRHYLRRKLRSTCHKVFAGQEAICRGCPALSALSSNSPQTSQIKRGHQTYEMRSFRFVWKATPWSQT